MDRWSSLAHALINRAGPQPPVEGGPAVVGIPPDFPEQRGMMLDPWSGIPLADVISPAGAHVAQSLIGEGGVGEFLPGLGDALDARAAGGSLWNAGNAALEGNWPAVGQYGSMAAISAMGALPGADAPNMKSWVPRKADDLAARLREKGLAVEVNHWPSQMGNSSYVKLRHEGSPWGPLWFVDDIRVSDHSVGPRRFGEHIAHVTDEADDLSGALRLGDSLLERVAARDAQYEAAVNAARALPSVAAEIVELASKRRPQLDRINAILRRAGVPLPDGGIKAGPVLEEFSRRLAE